jgi:hypothetical protein
MPLLTHGLRLATAIAFLKAHALRKERSSTCMPPHCDSIDGPIVRAAIRALDAQNVELVLPYVADTGEAEVRDAFEKVTPLRHDGAAVRALADRYFFETVVRVHRAGEGAPFEGLKPAGLDVGPVIRTAEWAIETGSADELVQMLTDVVRTEAQTRFQRVTDLKPNADRSVADAREYVQAMLGLQVWAHGLAEFARGHGPHLA